MQTDESGTENTQSNNYTLTDMKTYLHGSHYDITRSIEEDGEIVTAATSLAGKTIEYARHQYEVGSKEGGKIRHKIQSGLHHGVCLVKRFLHKNNYQVLAVATGTGVLIGYILAGRSARITR